MEEVRHTLTQTRLRAYLNPEEPTFLGFLILISLYQSLKGRVLPGLGRLRVEGPGLGWDSASSLAPDPVSTAQD